MCPEQTAERSLTFSNVPSSVLINSFFKKPITSSTFRELTMSRAISSAFLRTSMSGLPTTRRMSMTSSSRTCSCFWWRREMRERTIVLTLLEGSWMTSEIRQLAAAEKKNRSVLRRALWWIETGVPLTAAGF